jgi:hypothetical protein
VWQLQSVSQGNDHVHQVVLCLLSLLLLLSFAHLSPLKKLDSPHAKKQGSSTKTHSAALWCGLAAAASEQYQSIIKQHPFI